MKGATKVKKNKLKKYRLDNGLTQEAMAKKLGYTLSMYEKVEQGRTGTSAKFMERFKKCFPEACIDEIFFIK
jgi:DNA-binding XRE family transcriptional regulator